MGAALNYFTSANNKDYIGVDYGRKPVSNCNGGSVAGNSIQGFLNNALTLGVHGACGFIEYQNWWVF